MREKLVCRVIAKNGFGTTKFVRSSSFHRSVTSCLWVSSVALLPTSLLPDPEHCKTWSLFCHRINHNDMICHLSLTCSASSYLFLCHFIAGIVLIILLSLFHCCSPYFSLAVSTNFNEMKAISAVSPSRAVPSAWLSDPPIPNGILFTLFCTPLSSYHLHFRNGLLMGKSLPISSYIIYFFPFSFVFSFFIYFSSFVGLTFSDTSFMFLQSVSKGQSVL